MSKNVTLHCGVFGVLTGVGQAGRVTQNRLETPMSLLATVTLARVTREGITPEINRPDPAKVIAGDPVHSTWNLEEVDGLYCGLWQSTPGTWRVHYDEWEYIYIHSGHSILTDAAGVAQDLHAGDSFVIRPGFSGTWQVLETTLKDYVIRT